MSRFTAVSNRLRRSPLLSTALLVAAILGLALVPSDRPTVAEQIGPKPEDRQITRNITNLIVKEHLTRHPLDNEISRRWLGNYLKMLDPRKVFFSQADVDSFNVYRDQLDDMALRGDTSFAYLVFNKFLERIDERVRLVDELLPLPQDFTLDEEMEMASDPDDVAYVKEGPEMRERWRKRIKYELLDLANDKTKLEGKAAQDKISKRYHQLAKRMRQTDRSPSEDRARYPAREAAIAGQARV